MVNETLTLYDNPSREGTCWSCNVWKIRMLFNYKGLEYRSKWIHGPDITPTLWSLSIPPHKPGTALAAYTIPAVTMSDGTSIMESWKIAEAVEKAYPDKNVHLDSPVVKEVEKTMRKVLFHLQPLIVPRMPYNCLSGPTIPFHINARKRTFGMPLEEYAAMYGGEKGWEKVTPYLQSIARVLNRDPSGPFCLGSVPSYGDFLVVGMLEWVRIVGGGRIERLYQIDPAFEEVYKACTPWLERNNR